MANVPFYLQPTFSDNDPNLMFSIPIFASPSMQYEQNSVASIWDNLSEGTEKLVSQITANAGSVLDSATDFVSERIDLAVDIVKNPFDKMIEGFKWTLWLTIAGVLTLVYVISK